MGFGWLCCLFGPCCVSPTLIMFQDIGFLQKIFTTWFLGQFPLKLVTLGGFGMDIYLNHTLIDSLEVKKHSNILYFPGLGMLDFHRTLASYPKINILTTFTEPHVFGSHMF